jgi:hypothetical protein
MQMFWVYASHMTISAGVRRLWLVIRSGAINEHAHQSVRPPTLLFEENSATANALVIAEWPAETLLTGIAHVVS